MKKAATACAPPAQERKDAIDSSVDSGSDVEELDVEDEKGHS